MDVHVRVCIYHQFSAAQSSIPCMYSIKTPTSVKQTQKQSQALAISMGAGVAVMALIELFGKQMLARTIGADGPLLVPVSLKVCIS